MTHELADLTGHAPIDRWRKWLGRREPLALAALSDAALARLREEVQVEIVMALEDASAIGEDEA